MKTKYLSILGIIAIISALCCCSDSDDGATCSSAEENLISNSSFEFDGVQSLDGWNVENPAGVAYSDIVPPGGGVWSLEIDPGILSQTSYVVTYKIVPPEGEHQYRFSFWARRESVNGSARLWVKKSDVNLIIRNIGVASTYWIQYTAFATLTTQIGDTIFVEIDGGYVETSTESKTTFDLVEFIKLD